MSHIKTAKFDISVHSFGIPGPDFSWYAYRHGETVKVYMKTCTLEHSKMEFTSGLSSRYSLESKAMESVTRRYEFRKSKAGDWMRKMADAGKTNFDPCPGWIEDVLDAITNFLVNKMIVE